MTRRARLTVTKAGIVIGGAWTPPPPQPGSHAEAIQTALLSGPERRPISDRIAEIAAKGFAAFVEGLRSGTVIPLYLRHRRLGYSRSQSIARALWCWLPF